MTTVMDSRKQGEGNLRRRRMCLTCGHRFTTIEQVSDEDRKWAKPLVAPLEVHG